jgi:hypothetical protein
MPKASARAITWENWTTSMAPWIGEAKIFVNTTSMQVINIITKIPITPIHSSQTLNRRLRFSNLLSMVTNSSTLPLSPDACLPVGRGRGEGKAVFHRMVTG